MTRESTVVHELMLSNQAFVLLADAIRELSLQKGKLQRLKDVVAEGLRVNLPANEKSAAALKAYEPFDGTIRVYLRLTTRTNAELDRIKNDLNKPANNQFGVRETLVFLCLMICEPEKFACKI
ncbi:MAG: hypothetical protein C0456_19145 [Hyphomonas sp.]|jgi:hypothetical protein|uniref:hypothetical protein n=1 Tax=Hyphomonas sp. TaxID=87 RepID=UPI001D86B3B9|nr:hypothetical protein [Hyphomonas sp.]MBA4228724.1 hypothetical protein [Hyphomonas sp.]MEE4208767.1 hypothetical protein [Parvularcula sp.]